MHSIAFCTAIKNRLHHLKKTIVQNLIDNKEYRKLQFVILDYNSDDGLSDWVANTMQDHISSGRVVFYRTGHPEYFNRSHSRNMVMKLAKSDIVCNIDADNFTGANYARYIDDTFKNNDNIYLTSGIHKNDFLGRICCKKSDFELVGGYDEKMEGYGFEDYDFINRLTFLGRKKNVVTDPKFFTSITHPDTERICEERIYKSFQALYFRHISPSKTEILILFKNGVFNKGVLVDHGTDNSHQYKLAVKPVNYNFEFSLRSPSWNKGTWTLSEISLILEFGDNQKEIYIKEKKRSEMLFKGRQRYHPVENLQIITTILLFHSQFESRCTMLENLAKKNVKTNSSFGVGIVFKNFDNKNGITIN